ncbi:hypothetical protein [Antiquaquibacter soli]|uniref:LPXTG cell wall anchor domain-containing protein n=1 Tax=Antiquaquibacter soli TaxID=3064523 RepID=A0ABT9BIT6_9MICO|nr:hypothetical protein [Protaetiibacter sp. WY-16]MDO7880939.1 hypothetical protein [Protaetiibacter sp. WY-16]
MRRSILAAGVAAAALGLVVLPSAATAHTGNLYTWAYNPQVTPDVSGFATTSKTDAALAFLGADTSSEIDSPSGVEICAETAYAVSTQGDASVIVTWNHDTGALTSAPIDITIEDGAIDGVFELDTLLDCTVLTLAGLSGDLPGLAVISVDPATGAAAVVADLTEEPAEPTGIATNPSGATYLFGDVEGTPSVATFDPSTGVIGEWVEQAGIGDEFESTGFTQGVDFDAAGGLWIVAGINNEEQYHLLSYAAGADLATSPVTDIGILPYYSTPQELQIQSPIPLATDGIAVVAPQLAATGAELPLGVALGAGILLLCGLALIAVRRRTA